MFSGALRPAKGEGRKLASATQEEGVPLFRREAWTYLAVGTERRNSGRERPKPRGQRRHVLFGACRDFKKCKPLQAFKNGENVT